MNIEHGKHTIAIGEHLKRKDCDKLATIARHYLNFAKVVCDQSSGSDNYDVISDSNWPQTDVPDYNVITTGTKEYCIGFIDGSVALSDAFVVCGGMLVYPESRWGEIVDVNR